MKVDAIVIAGGENGEELQNISRVANEALIKIGNKVMVDYVVTALKNSPSVERIVIVGPVTALKSTFKEGPSLKLVAAGRTAIESVIKGLQYVSRERKLLICTGDIPLLTSEAIEDFLASCFNKEADLFYSIVPKEINERVFPTAQRTYVKLKEGTFTGGNVLLVNPNIIERCARKGEEIVKLRKSPLALSKLIGIRFILKYLLHSLSLSETEEKFSKLLGVKGVGVITFHPEIGLDVDKPSDLELVKKVLARKAS